MNTEEAAVAGGHMGGMSLPSDLTVFVIASVCVLCIAFFSAFEGLKGEELASVCRVSLLCCVVWCGVVIYF